MLTVTTNHQNDENNNESINISTINNKNKNKNINRNRNRNKAVVTEIRATIIIAIIIKTMKRTTIVKENSEKPFLHSFV